MLYVGWVEVDNGCFGFEVIGIDFVLCYGVVCVQMQQFCGMMCVEDCLVWMYVVVEVEVCFSVYGEFVCVLMNVDEVLGCGFDEYVCCVVLDFVVVVVYDVVE